MGETAHSSVLTAKRIKSPKWVLFASCILAAAADIFVLAVLGAGGFAGRHFVCPSVLLALDVLFAAGILLSNFRYRYSIAEVVVYLVGAALLICLTALVDMSGGKTTYVTRAASVCWIVFHALACLSVLASALYAAKLRRVFKSGAAICICALLAAACVLYAGFLSVKGFFGQGVGGVRTLVYTYLEDQDAYAVSGVLKGRGGTVVVPETFNGKQVVSFDCSVFTEEGVSAVRFDCGADVALENIAALSSFGGGVSVYADKENVDALKEVFYGHTGNAAAEDALFLLAANTYPCGLEENEIYVTFGYDSRAYDIVDGEVLPTWFGVRGEIFDAEEYAAEYPYLAHTDKTDAQDLHWSYENMQGCIAGELCDASGAPLAGKKLSESIGNVAVRFEKIYTVSLGADNDSKYETDESYGQTVLPDRTLPYRYTVKSLADTLLEIPERAGFALSWQYREGDGLKKELISLSSVLGEGVSSVTIYPEWSLDAPSVELRSESGVTSFTYGDSVSLSAEAVSAAEGISFRYEWSARGGVYSAGENTYALGTPSPSESGMYAVKVTAYSDTVTSLTSEGVASVSLSIAKKPVTFTWDIPEGGELVYSGTDKTVSCMLDGGQEVGGDVIGYSLSQNSVRDAGSYLIKVSFTGDAAEKYVAATGNGERRVVITPYEVTLEWSGNTFTYDGEEHLPAASADGVGEDGALVLTVYGAGINAGKYTARATVEDANYTVSNPSYAFTVEKRQISVSAWEDVALTYNGDLQYVRASALAGAVSGEESLILEKDIRYSVSTGGVNAGTHTVTATLSDASNYKFAAEQSREYEISKATVTLIWDASRTFVYDGTVKSVRAVSVTGAVQGEENAVLSALVYEGGAAEAGEHTMVASVSSSGNYVLSSSECSYTVEKRSLTVRFTGISKTYDGKTAEYVYRTEGLAAGDTLADVLTLIYGGTALSAKDAGTYQIEATFTAGAKGGNYSVSIVSAQLVIAKKAISVEWSASRNFVYDGSEQYVRVSEVVGAVSGEETSVIGSLVYAGKGIDAGNYTASVTLPSDSNYYFSSVQSCAYSIAQKTVELDWKEDVFTFVYDGGGKAPEAVCGESGVTVIYEYFTAEGVSLGNVKPTEIGSYKVTAKISEKNFKADAIVHEFFIVESVSAGEA